MAKLNLSNIGPMDNLIINGDFNMWQRGTSFAAVTNGTFTADRFSYHNVGAMIHTLSRSTDVPTQAESGHSSNYSLKANCTQIDGAIAAGDYCFLSHKLEGYCMPNVMGNTITVSFWVKATKTGTHCFAMRNSAGDKCWISEYTISASDTWEKKTITVTFNDSSGTWLYTNGVGLICNWSLAAGTDWQAAADTWIATNDWATSNIVNDCDTLNNEFYLSQVKFEIGSVATPYISQPVAAEIALCERYYQTNTGQETIATVYNASYIQVAAVNWNTEMVSTPTVVLSTISWLPASGGGWGTIGALYANNRDTKHLSFIYSTSGGTLGYSGKITYTYTADAEL